MQLLPFLPPHSTEFKTNHNRLNQHLLSEDQAILATSNYPIITLSASFRDIVEEIHNQTDDINHPDMVLSRAHFSMAYAAALEAQKLQKSETPQHLHSVFNIDPTQVWLVDPTNYVPANKWRKVAFTEFVGKTLARHPALTWAKKNILDSRARSKLPIAEVIMPILLDLVKKIPDSQPLICFHIEVGNLLAAHTKKTIIQAVTDPHVREQYTDFADRPNTFFAVFDEPTRTEFLEIARLRGKKVDPDCVIVTGPFIDPRVKAAAAHKSPSTWKQRPLRILLTTGGLGTNKEELAQILKILLPLTKKRADSSQAVELVYYAGTNHDHLEMVQKLARQADVAIGDPADLSAKLRLLYADDIFQANELLVEHGFPWAELIIAKPSGDMAYDAAASGSALLLLESWGEWEDNIASIFVNRGLARHIKVDQLEKQLEFLREPLFGEHNQASWLETALTTAQNLPADLCCGAKNILKVGR